MTKLILRWAYNLTRYLSCSMFVKRLAPWTTNMCLDKLFFFVEVLATVVVLFWQTGRGGQWQVSWRIRRPHIIHDLKSLCISTMWMFNFFLVKRTLKQELPEKETRGKRDQGEFNQYALLHHQAVLHYTIPPLPLHLLLIIIILLLLPLILLLLLLFNEVWKAPRPPLISCRTGTGLLLPQVPKY